jgi:hypothetical protein
MNLPRDTKSWAYQKQLEIILAKSPAERFLLGLKLCEDGRKIMEASILRVQPHLTPAELAAAIFDRLHGHRYLPARRAEIRASILRAEKEGG